MGSLWPLLCFDRVLNSLNFSVAIQGLTRFFLLASRGPRRGVVCVHVYWTAQHTDRRQLTANRCKW